MSPLPQQGGVDGENHLAVIKANRRLHFLSACVIKPDTMDVRSYNQTYRSGLDHIVASLTLPRGLLLALELPVEMDRNHPLGVEFRTGEDSYPAELQIDLAISDARKPNPQPNHHIVAVSKAPVAQLMSGREAFAAADTGIRIARRLSHLKLGFDAKRDSDSLY
jgi:hypothetical protein